MVLAGAKIYSDGVRIGYDAKEKVHQIVNVIKAISPSSDVSIRFIKNGHLYEGLLWGRANDIPIGVYKRGTSLDQVLENLFKRVNREALTTWRQPIGRTVGKKTSLRVKSDSLATAG